MYSKLNKLREYFLKIIIVSIAVFLFSISSVYAATDVVNKKMGKLVTYDHMLTWTLGLIVVLCLFFACIWFMRKMGALPMNSKQSMRVIGGLSLGMREKLVLVQLGEKQVLLGVTPGTITNLLVLEGTDCVFQNSADTQTESEFSQKLRQFMPGASHE